ncbi:6-carboxytetrahydropterin synthase [Bacteriovoracales bacterium]|nr:6-carboxytetrahydropterin synthase [Bacteriovoracales bacterium]
MPKFTSTKLLRGYPCTHRQWKAESHCRFVHGYSRDFYFEFACKELTKEGWVVDFGGLKEVKKWLASMFDHTFLSSQDDPYLEKFKELDKEGVLQLRVLPNAGMEGTAQFVYDHVNKMIHDMTQGRAWVTKVEVRENEKNSAYLEADETPDRV